MLVLASLAHASPAVTTRDLVFDDPERGRVAARVYLPPAAEGPYPLVGFLHGWLGQAWMYDDVCEAVAREGFVVASIDTETGVILDMTALAQDTIALLDYVAAGSEDDLVGLVSDAPWTALGHSMGGGTLGRLVGMEPRITTVVAFMPYEGDPADYATLAAWPGSALYLDGTEDTTAPPAMTDRWFDGFGGKRGVNLLIDGAGHQAVTDDPWGEVDSMTHADQHAVVIDLATAFLRAEVLGDEDRYRDLVGPGAPDVFAAIEGRSEVPAVWAELDDAGRIALGVVGRPGDTATVAIGTAPSADGLADGEVIGDAVALPDGWAVGEVELPVWTGDLWLQVELGDGTRVTRAVQLGEAADPTSPAPSTDATVTTPADAASGGVPAVEAGCGCASTGSAGPGLAAIGLALAIGLVRRRPPV